MTRVRALVPAIVAWTLLSSCVSAAPDPATTTFIVVRHAEKTSDTERDPELSAAGLERAQALARQLADDDLVAVYTSDYRRTRQTAQPSATVHRLEAMVYDAQLPADEFARLLRAAHRRGTVLVAGHSNTVPGIVAALCACETRPMPDTEYDRLSTIHVDADGRAHLVVTRYGVSSPSR